MNPRVALTVVTSLAATLPLLTRPGAAREPDGAQPTSRPAGRWFKGNTHTHTLNSDGDSAPDDVVRWYREHGYHFVVLTDHNYLTQVDALNGLLGAEGKFLVIRGEEVIDGLGGKPIHVNGLNVERRVAPQGGASVVDVVQRNVNAVRDARGVPHINHPNFSWAISPEELAQVRNYRLFEIFNGHPLVNNVGGGDSPGLEAVWDRLLSSGQLVYGIAVDDAHHFKRPWDPYAARPGRGWVTVRAEELSPPALLGALERGDFYASTGVVLRDYTVDDRRITIAVDEVPTSKYRVLFIGRGGRVLEEAAASPATYTFTGDEGYVRAKVIDSNGNVAWTQPHQLPTPNAQLPR
jgi:hypothetical protein